VIGCTIEKQQDVLPGKLCGQGIKKDLEAFGVRGRHDQVAPRHPDRDGTGAASACANHAEPEGYK
jgi:hypothetical protein